MRGLDLPERRRVLASDATKCIQKTVHLQRFAVGHERSEERNKAEDSKKVDDIEHQLSLEETCKGVLHHYPRLLALAGRQRRQFRGGSPRNAALSHDGG